MTEVLENSPANVDLGVTLDQYMVAGRILASIQAQGYQTYIFRLVFLCGIDFKQAALVIKRNNEMVQKVLETPGGKQVVAVCMQMALEEFNAPAEPEPSQASQEI